MTRPRRPILRPAASLLAAGLSALAPASGASAQDRVSVRVQPYAAPALGQVVRGMTDTTFSISSSGVVRRVSGDAVRLSSAPATPPTVVVDCHGRCERPMRIRVQPTGGEGASVVRLRATDLQGGVARSDAAAAEGGTLALEVDPAGAASVNFVLEMEVRVRAEGAGPQPINYIVTVDML